VKDKLKVVLKVVALKVVALKFVAPSNNYSAFGKFPKSLARSLDKRISAALSGQAQFAQTEKVDRQQPAIVWLLPNKAVRSHTDCRILPAPSGSTARPDAPLSMGIATLTAAVATAAPEISNELPPSFVALSCHDLVCHDGRRHKSLASIPISVNSFVEGFARSDIDTSTHRKIQPSLEHSYPL
jgi:hypothetical protein